MLCSCSLNSAWSVLVGVALVSLVRSLAAALGRITGEATHFELGSELHNGGVSLLEQLVGGLGGKSSALRIFST